MADGAHDKSLLEELNHEHSMIGAEMQVELTQGISSV
jgi:hypothetical protein